MVLLSISIVIALLIIFGLPIAAGFWLKKKLNVPWQVMIYGVLGYFIVQALVSIIYTGLTNIIENWNTAAAGDSFLLSQILISVFLGAILGVLVRWLGMKYLKLTTIESAYSIGVGYGGAESIMLVGIPLLMTFTAMISNINIDPQTTELDPAVVTQIESLWQLDFYIPLATSLERIAAFLMHITVTLLILQVFKTKKLLWLGAAFGLEFIINGLVVGLSEAGVQFGWVILLALVFMVVNIYILYRLNAFDFALNQPEEESVEEVDLTQNQ
jgi:uncharacterized membrane protein YhfC